MASSDVIAKSRKLSGPFLSVRARLIEKTTSAGVSGLPSENFTPGRRLNVKVLLVLARPCSPSRATASACPAGEVMKSGSKILSSV